MLTVQREKFVQGVVSGLSLTDAYIAAYPNAAKWKGNGAGNKASALAAEPAIRMRIESLREKNLLATEELFSLTHAQIKAAVLQDAWEVVSADPSELITYRRLNCRYCHGMGNEYRWRDEAEHWAELARVAGIIETWNPKRGKPPELPTCDGGFGFKRLAPPSPDCPKCEGEGIEEARVSDIRTLSGPARRLYAGVKVKKDGSIEVLTRDKEAARQLLAKHAGLIDDKVKVTGLMGVATTPLTPEVASAIAKQLQNDV